MEQELDAFPHAPMAEKSVLSCMFHQPELIARAAADGIDDSAFHLSGHKNILKHLITCRDKGQIIEGENSIDLSIFVQTAQMDGILERMGGAADVVGVHNYAPNANGWTKWVEMLRECKARRIARVASQTLSGISDSQEAIEAATVALDAMKRAITPKSRAMNAKIATDDFLRKYLANMEGGDMPGQTTGIQEIDNVTGGMRPGELWTIGGPSSSGKSVFMYQIASPFIQEGKPVAVFSLELMPHEIIGRLICLAARVPYDTITNPKTVKQHELGRIQTAVHGMSASHLWIDGTGGQTLATIEAEAERIRDIEGGLALIVVDYIQIVSGQRGRNETREQEIARISGGLKQLAKQMECPVLTGTQLNEAGKTRESRAIEQDSDCLFIIEDGGITLKKVRNGERGRTINIALDGSQQRFRRFSD